MEEQAKVYVLPTQSERRENALALRMRDLGIGTRESALLAREAAVENAEYWYRKAMTARYVNKWMLDILLLANDRHAASEALLREALAELTRLRELIR